MWDLGGIAQVQGLRFICFDFYGDGESSWPDHVEKTAPLLAEQAFELLAHLDLSKTPVHIIGYSLGGNLAVYMAAQKRQPIASLFLLSPAGLPFKMPMHTNIIKVPVLAEIITGIAGKFGLVDGVKLEFYDKHHPMIELQQRCVSDLWDAHKKTLSESLLSVMRHFPYEGGFVAEYETVGTLGIPTALFWGQNDEIVPCDVCFPVAERILRPVRSAIFPQTGHSVLLEQRERTLTEFRIFMAAFARSTPVKSVAFDARGVLFHGDAREIVDAVWRDHTPETRPYALVEVTEGEAWQKFVRGKISAAEAAEQTGKQTLSVMDLTRFVREGPTFMNRVESGWELVTTSRENGKAVILLSDFDKSAVDRLAAAHPELLAPGTWNAMIFSYEVDKSFPELIDELLQQQQQLQPVLLITSSLKTLEAARLKRVTAVLCHKDHGAYKTAAECVKRIVQWK